MIQNTIENAIRAAYAAGKTQMQIAHMIGASDAYANLLLSGKRSFGGLTLAKIDRAWPRAEILLDGMPPPAPAVAQTAHHALTISQSVGGDAGRLDAVRAIVGSAQLTDTEKIRALRPLLGME
jgi:hypothetical protein